jgi:hypothetical protein
MAAQARLQNLTLTLLDEGADGLTSQQIAEGRSGGVVIWRRLG